MLTEMTSCCPLFYLQCAISDRRLFHSTALSIVAETGPNISARQSGQNASNKTSLPAHKGYAIPGAARLSSRNLAPVSEDRLQAMPAWREDLLLRNDPPAQVHDPVSI